MDVTKVVVAASEEQLQFFAGFHDRFRRVCNAAGNFALFSASTNLLMGEYRSMMLCGLAGLTARHVEKNTEHELAAFRTELTNRLATDVT